MKFKTLVHQLIALSVVALGVGGAAQADSAARQLADNKSVTLLKTPNEGIQPQAMLDTQGTLHLIYFKGKPAAGDLFYLHSEDGGKTFSTPLRVNSEESSAIAMGTIRGAHLAIGKDNRLHIAWNGSNEATKGVGGNPMLYTRLNEAGTAFEPQRNLVTHAGGLDGGGTIAADSAGNVYVAWHAAAGAKSDAERAVYLARSTDNGQTFESEKKISVQSTGACGCCQMRAFVDSNGALSILYRAAENNINRDSILLVSTDKGAKFGSAVLHPWNVMMCPMSSYALTQSKDGVRAAWETEDQIFTASVQPASAKFSTPIAAPGKGGNRKHPVIVADANGQTLLAWTEGTGWKRGGSLAWQIFDAKGAPTAQKGSAAGVPVWSLLSAVARPDGGFLLFY